MSNIQSIIEDAFENRSSITPKSVSDQIKNAVHEAINGLNKESNQPIEYKNITLICNGEIYNYKELYYVLNIEPNTALTTKLYQVHATITLKLKYMVNRLTP